MNIGRFFFLFMLNFEMFLGIKMVDFFNFLWGENCLKLRIGVVFFLSGLLLCLLINNCLFI